MPFLYGRKWEDVPGFGPNPKPWTLNPKPYRYGRKWEDVPDHFTSVPADQMALGIAPKDHVGTVEVGLFWHFRPLLKNISIVTWCSKHPRTMWALRRHTHMCVCVYTSQNVFSTVTFHRKCTLHSKSTLYRACPKEMYDSTHWVNSQKCFLSWLSIGNVL
jgi:hypothetical protein